MLREKIGYSEYYIIENPANGFLLLDSKGLQRLLLIYTNENLKAHVLQLNSLSAPNELITKVERAELLQGFSINDEDETQSILSKI